MLGKWAPANGTSVESITFPDGNVWSTMTEPTDAFSADDFVDEAVGIFMDPNHYKGAASFAGLRFIAIFPSQTIQMVGSDDGDPAKLWFLDGDGAGDPTNSLIMDFSPKGGPAELIGTWEPAPKRTITWADGNVWAKPGSPVDTDDFKSNLLHERPAERERGIGGVRLLALLVVAVAMAAAMRSSYR